MNLRTQLFLPMALLVIALLAAQWWIQQDQIRRLEAELSEVATTVGRVMVTHSQSSAGGTRQARKVVWVARGAPPEGQPGALPGTPPPNEGAPGETQTVEIGIDAVDVNRGEGDRPEEPPQGGSSAAPPGDPQAMREVEEAVFLSEGLGPPPDPLEVDVHSEGGERVLVLKGLPGEPERRIPLGGTSTREIVQASLQEGLFASLVLLGLGFVGAGLIAHRLTGPLRDLGAGVKALGAGGLGHQIPLSGPGEIRAVQGAFNEMSQRLAHLEEERRRWRARAHLAELGDLARGLGHTLRNPLNTLGLAVEELARQAEGPEGAELAATARGQIQRIDRWLRSFLAVGAGEAAAPARTDLGALLEGLALEHGGGEAPLELELPADPVSAPVVPRALEAALSNLIANAVEASPPNEPVRVTLSHGPEGVEIRIEDRGPGLPDSVRQRLFSPHVSTKAHGSGMGLFLARQLIEGGHGGQLSLNDRPGGGTQALVCLPHRPEGAQP